MTDSEKQGSFDLSVRPPWYGGNKIPASYLKRFMPSQGKHDDMPYELGLFLENLK